MRIRLLGGFEVDVAGRPVQASAWRLSKAADLVKLLALSARHRLHRDQVLEILWPDKDPDAAANNLYQAVHAARAALGQAAVRLQGGILGLAEDGLSVDVDVFESAVRAALQGKPGAHDEARRLYRGDLLPDDLYADWLADRRLALAASYRRVVTDLASLREKEGRLDEAIGALAELFEAVPSDEEVARRLMRLEARAGQRAVALQHYSALAEALRRDVDAAPSAATTALHKEILSAAADGSVESSRWRTNLPASVTSFVGRQRELGEIEVLIAPAHCLTLTGTGGTGKTRLAVEAARRLRGQYPDGTWLVELAAIPHAALVARAVGETLDVREITGVALVDRIAEEIGDRRLLLVVDNCEHVVSAAAEVVGRLIGRCPNLRVLATSRQPLRVAGETVFRIASLPIPDPTEETDPAQLEAIDAVHLFVDRARSASPTFEMTAANAASVARVCHDLDGLPLALELAASRTASIPVDVLADRLDERFKLLVGGDRMALTRQQTLEATLDWSYNLLAQPEQVVLQRASVFAGGMSLMAAEQVCAGSDIERSDVLPILGQLVDQSMLTIDDGRRRTRYSLLETVREYGRRLASGSTEAQSSERAHLAWAVRFAADPAADLALELENLRVALDRGIRLDPPAALALAESMWPFWLWQGHLVEGRRWLERTLGTASELNPTRGHALCGLGALHGRAGDTLEHERRAHEAVELFEALGDRRQMWQAMQFRGCAPWAADHLDPAEAIFREALRVAEEIGDLAAQASTLNCSAIIEWYRGRSDNARRMFEQSLDLFRNADVADLTTQVLDIGEMLVPEPASGGVRLAFQETFGTFRNLAPPLAAAFVRGNLGMLARAGGELELAAGHLRAALSEFETLRDDRGRAHTLARLGNLAAARGELAEARQQLEACLEIRRRLGDSRGVSLAESNLGYVEMLAGRLDRADELIATSVEAFRRRGDMWGLAAALGNQASVGIERGDLAGARQSLEGSLEASRSTGRIRWVGWNTLRLAAVERLDGRRELSRELAANAAELFRTIPDPTGETEATRLL